MAAGAPPLKRIEQRIGDGLSRHSRVRIGLALAVSICGGLAALFLFFVLVGTVHLGRATAATAVAAGLALVWLIGFTQRVRTGSTRVQRHDRERRGF
jgi:ABC-type nickel/cobalt efflux system permease component RcnA